MISSNWWGGVAAKSEFWLRPLGQTTWMFRAEIAQRCRNGEVALLLRVHTTSHLFFGLSFNILRRCFMRQNAIRVGWGDFTLWTQLMINTSIQDTPGKHMIPTSLPTRCFGLCWACVLCSNTSHVKSSSLFLGRNPDKQLRVTTNACMCERQRQTSAFKPAAWWTDRRGHTTKPRVQCVKSEVCVANIWSQLAATIEQFVVRIWTGSTEQDWDSSHS